jgi:hypothetical protein
MTGRRIVIDKLEDPFSMAIQETVIRDNERLGVLFTRGPKGLFQVCRALHG